MELFHIIIEIKSIYQLAYGVEIPLHRTAKLNTYVNHDFEGTGNQRLFITSGENNRFDHTNMFAQVSNNERKGTEFEFHHCHTVEKKWTVKDVNKKEIDKIFRKSKVYNNNNEKQRMISISHSQGNSDMQDIYKTPSNNLNLAVNYN